MGSSTNLLGINTIKEGGVWVICADLSVVPIEAANPSEFGELANARIISSIPGRRLTWWVGRRIILAVVMELLGISQEEALEYMAGELVSEEHGKPYLRSSLFHFSISHSANILFMAVSLKPCSIDVELLKQRKSYQAVLERMLAPKEQSFVIQSNFDGTSVLKTSKASEMKAQTTEEFAVGVTRELKAISKCSIPQSSKLNRDADFKDEEHFWGGHTPALKLEGTVSFQELGRFYMLWTIKETAVKLTGRGLVGLPEFTFLPSDDLVLHEGVSGIIASTLIRQHNEVYGLSWYSSSKDTSLAWSEFNPLNLSFSPMIQPKVAKELVLRPSSQNS